MLLDNLGAFINNSYLGHRGRTHESTGPAGPQRSRPGLSRHRLSSGPSRHPAVAGAGSAGISSDTEPRQQSPRPLCPVQQCKTGAPYESNSNVLCRRPVSKCLALLRMSPGRRSADIMVAGQSQATVRRHKTPVPINRPPHPLAHLTTAPPKPLAGPPLLTQKHHTATSQPAQS